MPKGTLKKAKSTSTLEIVSVDDQNPNYDRYLKRIDHFWRIDGGHHVITASGFVCYLGWERPGLGYRAPRVGEFRKLRMVWIRGMNDFACRAIQTEDEVERALRERFSGRLWLTYLKGQRHDYYFYSQADIETSLELMDVAQVMVS